MRYRRYSDDQLKAAVLKSVSVAGVLRELEIKPAGGSHSYISRKIKLFELDTSHFSGGRTNSGEKHKGGCQKRTWMNVLVLRTEGRKEATLRLRRALLEMGRPYQCEICGNVGKWESAPLVLQVDHKNQNWLDNRPENLRFLCPNCHSQTAGWCRCRSDLSSA